MAESGREIVIQWYYRTEDDTMLRQVRTFKKFKL